MKYLFLIQLFLSGLFAHSEGAGHLHFFSSWHLESFVVFLVFVICGFGLFKYFRNETN